MLDTALCGADHGFHKVFMNIQQFIIPTNIDAKKKTFNFIIGMGICSGLNKKTQCIKPFVIMLSVLAIFCL